MIKFRNIFIAILLFVSFLENSSAAQYVVQNPINYSNSVSIYSFGYSVPFNGVVEDTYTFNLSHASDMFIGLGYSERFAQFPEFGSFVLSGSAGVIPVSSGNFYFSPTQPNAQGSFFGLQPGDYSVFVHVQQIPTIDSAFNYQFSMQSVALPDPQPLPVPEPESFAMMLAGLCLIGAIARHRKTA